MVDGVCGKTARTSIRPMVTLIVFSGGICLSGGVDAGNGVIPVPACVDMFGRIAGFLTIHEEETDASSKSVSGVSPVGTRSIEDVAVPDWSMLNRWESGF